MWAGREIRFRQRALEKLEREGFIGGTHEDDAQNLKGNIATFLDKFPGSDIALIQPNTWDYTTLRFILDIGERLIEVADVEVIHPSA